MCFSALIAAGLGLLLAGCAWGVVRDAQTGQPIVGAQVQFQDSTGKSGVTTSGAGGLYSFDAVQGQPIPAIGPVTFRVTASGYDTLTEQRDVSFDEGGGLWEVQSFALSRGGSGSGTGGSTPQPTQPPENSPPVWPTDVEWGSYETYQYDDVGHLIGVFTWIQILTPCSDADGDPLTYTWTASNGSISGDGLTAVWTREHVGAKPTSGTVTVTCSDGRGGSAILELEFITIG